MQCQEFEQVWIERSDEELPAAAAAHLGECPICHAMVTDFGAITLAGEKFGAEEIAPPERVWLALQAQLEAEGLLRSRPRSTWREAWASLFARPVVAAAYLALLLVAAAFISIRVQAPPGTADLSAQAQPSLIKNQMAAVQAQETQWLRRNESYDVSETLRRNMALVDKLIALCEKTVREQPQNELAREYLYGAYQQKAELLATLTDRGALGD
jgi:hypothetical protein